MIPKKKKFKERTGKGRKHTTGRPGINDKDDANIYLVALMLVI
jgi:hypothetical protein